MWMKWKVEDGIDHIHTAAIVHWLKRYTVPGCRVYKHRESDTFQKIPDQSEIEKTRESGQQATFQSKTTCLIIVSLH